MTQPENPLVNLGTDLGIGDNGLGVDLGPIGVDVNLGGNGSGSGSTPNPQPEPDPEPEPQSELEPEPTAEDEEAARKERWRQECESWDGTWDPNGAGGRGVCHLPPAPPVPTPGPDAAGA